MAPESGAVRPVMSRCGADWQASTKTSAPTERAAATTLEAVGEFHNSDCHFAHTAEQLSRPLSLMLGPTVLKEEVTAP